MIWLASLIMFATILLAALNGSYIGEIMLAGAVLMVLSGILTLDDAYQTIDWKSIIVIVGMLPLGIAMTNSGLATIIGGWVGKLAGPAGPPVLLVILVILAVLLSQVMYGPAVAAMMVPVGIGVAVQLGSIREQSPWGLPWRPPSLSSPPLGIR